MRLLIYCLFVTFFPPQTRCCLNMEFLGKHMYYSLPYLIVVDFYSFSLFLGISRVFSSL